MGASDEVAADCRLFVRNRLHELYKNQWHIEQRSVKPYSRSVDVMVARNPQLDHSGLQSGPLKSQANCGPVQTCDHSPRVS